MALTVTPGGTADDALVSLAAFQTYCAARGYSLTGKPDATQEQSIRRGTVWVEGLGRATKGGTRWPGVRSNDAQRRIWPRTGATYRDGAAIDGTTIPAAVQEATCEAALFDLNNAGVLQANVTPAQIVKSAGAGPAKVTFQDVVGPSAARLMLSTVDDLLADVLLPEGYTIPGVLVV